MPIRSLAYDAGSRASLSQESQFRASSRRWRRDQDPQLFGHSRKQSRRTLQRLSAIYPRLHESALAAFALAAVALAVTGIYAVIMYSVSQRTPEIGIRVALGAGPSSIVRLVLGEGARLIVIGLVLGTVMAVGLMSMLATMLFGLTAGDLPTLAQVAAAVSAVSLLACGVPAIRAVRLAHP